MSFDSPAPTCEGGWEEAYHGHEFPWPRKVLFKRDIHRSSFFNGKIFFCSEKLHLLQNCAVSKDLQPDHLVERFYFERFLEGGQEELRPDWSERRWNRENLEITFLDKTMKNLLPY